MLEKYSHQIFLLATSGYAGPTGGTVLNPVGTVFIAVSQEKSNYFKTFFVFRR